MIVLLVLVMGDVIIVQYETVEQFTFENIKSVGVSCNLILDVLSLITVGVKFWFTLVQYCSVHGGLEITDK